MAAGVAAAPVPLAETLTAGMLLGRAGLAIPSGPLTVAVASGPGAGLGRLGELGSARGCGGCRTDGCHDGGRRVRRGQRLAGRHRASRPGRDGRGGTGRNLAGEPRDEVIFGGDAEVHDAPAGTADYARRLLRLFRSLLIAGAAQRALDLTVTYVQEREQFGRPLARFPTVQQELARMAGEVALISAATQAAVAAEDLTAAPAWLTRASRAPARGCLPWWRRRRRPAAAQASWRRSRTSCTARSGPRRSTGCG